MSLVALPPPDKLTIDVCGLSYDTQAATIVAGPGVLFGFSVDPGMGYYQWIRLYDGDDERRGALLATWKRGDPIGFHEIVAPFRRGLVVSCYSGGCDTASLWVHHGPWPAP